MTHYQPLRITTGMFRRLRTLIIEKPWGRTDIPADFGDFGNRRIGEIWFAHPDDDAAPIMVKFLFTSQRLSIQVHPDDAAARKAGDLRGKDECWLVLSADPGSVLGVGLNAPVTPEALREAALDGSIVDRIDWRPAAVDDFVYNPAGNIHALGGGLTIVEVQQNVDRTYRLYDYGRPRELHLDDGLAVARLAPVAEDRDGRIDPAANRKLVDGPPFHVLHLVGPCDPAILAEARGELTFVPLSPGCRIAGEDIHRGEAILLDNPALIGIESGARALLCWAD